MDKQSTTYQKPHFFRRHDYQMSRSLDSQTTSTTKYIYLVYGYYYCCNNFGHKAINFRAYVRRIDLGNFKMRKNGFTNIKTNVNLDKNAFSPLLYIIECFYCHKFGHKLYECQLKDNRLTS